MTVPVHLEGTPLGVKEGGVLAQPLHELEIRCLPKDIPGHVTVDVSALQMGDSLHVSDLNLGDAVDVLTDATRTIVTVTAPRVEVEPETEEGLGLDAELGAEDEEAPEEGGEETEG